MAIVKLRIPLLIVAASWLAGCAAPGAALPSTESGAVQGTALVDSRSDRQIRRDEWADKFRADRARCLNGGGRIVVMASRSLDRKGIPARGDRYFCQ